MERLIGILLMLVLLTNCKTINRAISPPIFNDGNIVFEQYTEVTEQGKTQADKLFEDIINKAPSDSNQTYSKAELLAFKSMVLADMFNENKSEVTINVHKDTIWRINKQGERFIDYNRIEKSNGFLHFYEYPNISIESRHMLICLKKTLIALLRLINTREKRY